MSGYPDDAIRLKEILDTGASFINKPFSADILAAKIREILDREEDREEDPGI